MIPCYKSGKLTKREKQILLLLYQGKNEKQIAKELFITPATARTHINRVYKKKYVNGQCELLAHKIKELGYIINEFIGKPNQTGKRDNTMLNRALQERD